MATYLVLNLIVIGLVVFALRIRPHKPSRPWTIALIGLLVLTAIFDNVIISLGIVGYDPTKLLGIYVGLAPVEDFFYAVLAVLLVPVLWNKIGASHDRNN